MLVPTDKWDEHPVEPGSLGHFLHRCVVQRSVVDRSVVDRCVVDGSAAADDNHSHAGHDSAGEGLGTAAPRTVDKSGFDRVSMDR